MEQVRRIALEQAAAQGAGRIHRMQLRIGRLSGVDPDALAFAFDVVMADGAPGSAAGSAPCDGTDSVRTQGATLDLEVVPTVCFCPDCEQTFEPLDVIFTCPVCGGVSQRIERGRELELIALEVS
jgi:hydrogenase nickel incorporation protein HypA/HybF